MIQVFVHFESIESISLEYIWTQSRNISFNLVDKKLLLEKFLEIFQDILLLENILNLN